MVLPDRRAFSALVVFNPGGKPSARYDLFEVDTDGTLSDLSEDTFPDSDPDIAFSIEGTPAATLVAAPKAAPALKKSPPKKKAPKKRNRP